MARLIRTHLLLLFLASSPLATANTCSAIQNYTSISVATRNSDDYASEQSEYWSTACSALQPSCILFPSSTADVVEIVHVLSQNADRFAVKSGGHNPNNGFASIDDAPLLSTKKLDEVTLDTTTGTVRVGPGNRWDDVALKLNGTGWTVVGGRIGNVGVGGYVLGGGLSFLSQRYGWAVSSVLEMEVVLANGTAVNASATKNSDLFTALKGGGNNYGIVTSYLLQGYKQKQVWGGTYMFQHSNATDAKLLAALRDFTQYNKDNKAAIILTAQRTASALGSRDMWTMFVFYDGETPPTGTFDNFTNANPFYTSVKTRSYYDLLSSNNNYVSVGSVYTIGTETMPLPHVNSGTKVMGDIHQHWRNVSAPIIDAIPNSIVVQAYQPFPKRMARVSRDKGSDLMDMDDEVDRIIIEINYAYQSNADAKRIDKAMKNTYKGIRSLVTEWQREGVLKDAYLPLFMNDAYYAQDYFSRLTPENRELAKKVAKRVDPQKMFKTRTGGFKP